MFPENTKTISRRSGLLAEHLLGASRRFLGLADRGGLPPRGLPVQTLITDVESRFRRWAFRPNIGSIDSVRRAVDYPLRPERDFRHLRRFTFDNQFDVATGQIADIPGDVGITAGQVLGRVTKTHALNAALIDDWRLPTIMDTCPRNNSAMEKDIRQPMLSNSSFQASKFHYKVPSGFLSQVGFYPEANRDPTAQGLRSAPGKRASSLYAPRRGCTTPSG